MSVSVVDKISVVAKRNSIAINGVAKGGIIRIYDIEGRPVYSGCETVITGVADGVYIVVAGGQAIKVML